MADRQSLERYLKAAFGAQVDEFGYSLSEWVEALDSLIPLASGEPVERLAGYVACCAEAGARSGRLIPLKDEVLRHHQIFGLESRT
jgi:hypothetical protein